MSATLELLDRFKAARALPSDNAAALELGITRQTINNWRKRASQGEPRVIEKMCNAVGVEPGPWLIRMLAERSPHPEDRKVWRRMAKRMTLQIHIFVWLSGALAREAIHWEGLASAVAGV
jgi:transcriptional regulator with XRE-family HTH domain